MKYSRFSESRRVRGLWVDVSLWRFAFRFILWHYELDRDWMVLFACVLSFDYEMVVGAELAHDGLAEVNPEATPAYWRLGWRGRWRTLKREAA